MLSSSARELGRCISPMKRDKVKVSFRLISPNPSALDYSPGRTYYFISTSTGTVFGLSNRYGGLCASHNLKMIIHVTEKNGDTSGKFLSSVGRHGESTIWSTVSRGERLTLDSDNRRHEYNALSLRDEVDFQIHEIGDKDDLFSSGCCPEILVTVISICVFVFKS
ncbi:Ephrin [Dictyocaulus viviparus]|uniref:Ephrin n=1 Tax=Dictyocaulus viviparus TaxID=29172 RepID=A0A0D8Y051_DICVI|nr:Ephrin [Dictyocaulus viviparus]